MTKKSNQKNIANKIVSKRTLDQNITAFKTYDTYKNRRYYGACGVCIRQKISFKSNTGSTLNFEINRYGAYSTTTQKI